MEVLGQGLQALGSAYYQRRKRGCKYDIYKLFCANA